MIVFVLTGWFGDQEWTEGIYADPADAHAEHTRLWMTRSSQNGPEYANGVKKFAVEPVEVIPSSRSVAAVEAL